MNKGETRKSSTERSPTLCSRFRRFTIRNRKQRNLPPNRLSRPSLEFQVRNQPPREQYQERQERLHSLRQVKVLLQVLQQPHSLPQAALDPSGRRLRWRTSSN